MTKIIETIKAALTKKVSLTQRDKEQTETTYILLNSLKYFTLFGTIISAYILFLAFGGYDNLFEAAGKAILIDLSVFFFMQMLLRSGGFTQVMTVTGFAFVTLLSIYQSMEYQLAKYLQISMTRINLAAINEIDAYQWFSAFRQGGVVQVILFFLGIGQPAFTKYLEKKQNQKREETERKLRNAEAWQRVKANKIAQGIPIKKRGRPVGWKKPLTVINTGE